MTTPSTLLVEDPCCDDTLVEIANKCPKLEVLQLWRGATDCALSKCHKLHRVEELWDSIAFVYLQSLAATLPQFLVSDRFDDHQMITVSM